MPGVLTAVSMDGRLVARGPVESYPFRLPLSQADRIALVRSGLKLRRAVARYDREAKARAGEPESARRDRMLAFLGDETFSEFIGPLPPGAEALYRPTVTRSSGELDELAAGHGVGYFHLVWRKGEGLSRNIVGGSSVLTDALAAPLGDRVLCGARVLEVGERGPGVAVRYERDGETSELDARFVVLATPAYAAAVVAASLLPTDLSEALRSIPYGPYVVVALATSEPEHDAVGRPLRGRDARPRLQHGVQPRERPPRERQPAAGRQPDALLGRAASRRPASRAARRRDRRALPRRPRRGVPRSARPGSTRPSSSAGRARCRIRTRGATGSSPCSTAHSSGSPSPATTSATSTRRPRSRPASRRQSGRDGRHGRLTSPTRPTPRLILWAVSSTM